MKRAFKLLAAVAFANLAATRRASHPFVGEHADATSITREDGSVAMKMTRKRGGINKYASMIDKTANYSPS